MSKTVTPVSKVTPANNQANMQNANKGTIGTNKQNAQSQGNRGQQLNPNKRGDANSTGKNK